MRTPFKINFFIWIDVKISRRECQTKTILCIENSSDKSGVTGDKKKAKAKSFCFFNSTSYHNFIFNF